MPLNKRPTASGDLQPGTTKADKPKYSIKILLRQEPRTEAEIDAWIDKLDAAGFYTLHPGSIVRAYSNNGENGDLMASIWGVIKSFQQMTNNACTLSQATIGRFVGCSKKTVCLKLQILIDDNYIELFKDNRSIGRPNWYKTTDKCRLAESNGYSRKDEDEPARLNNLAERNE